jgi:hypothetical protein
MKAVAVSIFLALTPLPAFGAPAPSPAVPVLSADTGWVFTLLWVVAGIFVAVAILGPLIRRSLPDEILPTHSHDEPPGSSHHHGPTGTVDLVAPDRHHHR